MVILHAGDFTLRARSSALARGAVLQDFTSCTLIERFNLPDTLQLEGSWDALRPVLQPGAGVILDDGTGAPWRFSGPVSEIVRRGDRTATVTFESDLIWLWGRIVFPDPTNVITPSQATGYDVRTGAAETVAVGYINANAGPAAVSPRHVTGLSTATSLGRGGTVTISARLDVLGRLVADIGEAAGLRFRVTQSGSALVVDVDAAPNLSSTARYGTPEAGGPGLLGTDWSWTMTRPSATRMVVGGGGQGRRRDFSYLTDSAAETLWGGATEAFYDASSEYSDTQSAFEDWTDKVKVRLAAIQAAANAAKALTAAQRKKAITAEARANHSNSTTIQNDNDAAQDVTDATADLATANADVITATNDRDTALIAYNDARAAYLLAMDAGGQQALDEATSPVEIDAPTVLDAPDSAIRLGTDVPLGSLITLDLDGELLVERLRTVTTVIQASDGTPSVSVSGSVGSPDAGLTRTQKEFLAMRRQLRKVVTR